MSGERAGFWRPGGVPDRSSLPPPGPVLPRPYQPVPAWITHLAGFGDPDQSRVVVTSYAGARAVLDLRHGGLVGIRDERARATACAAASIDGEWLVVTGTAAGHLQVGDPASGRPRWRVPCGEVRSLVTAPVAGHPYAVLAGGSTRVRIWALVADRGEPVATLDAAPGRVSVLVARGVGRDALVAAGTANGRIRVWRLSRAGSGRLAVEPVRNHAFEAPALVAALAIVDHAGRPTLLGAAGTVARAWDLVAGRPVGPAFTRHTGRITGLAATGEVVWSSDDGTVQGWSPGTGEPVGPALRYPSDGSLTCLLGVRIAGRPALATGDGAGTVWVWDAERPGPFVPDVPSSGR